MNDKRKQRMIRRSRGRRGAGIEMAMLLMVVAVALSGLLTSVAIMQIGKQKSSEEQLEQLKQHMVLDQIGREFCSQRGGYEVPEDLGLHEAITFGYGTDESGAEKECPGCCSSCAECDEIYAEPEEDDGSSGDTETAENAEGSEGPERPACCDDCGCTRGCTGFSEISLEVTDSGEVVLTVVLANNGDGTYTVTEWSYGE